MFAACLLTALLPGIDDSPPSANPADGAAPALGNLGWVRNGSFEGGLLYWHDVDREKQRLVRGTADAPVPSGEYALELNGGSVYSAPIDCPRGSEATISFWARSSRPDGVAEISLTPSAREVGAAAGRLWNRDGAVRRPLTDRWTRHEATFPADVPATGFWPDSRYMIVLGGSPGRQIDDVAVSFTPPGATDRVRAVRPEVETVTEVRGLPGYVPAGNLLPRDATVEVVAHVHNRSAGPRTVEVRWEWADWTGDAVLSRADAETLTLPAGGSASPAHRLTLPQPGCLRARTAVALVSGSDADGAGVATSSSDWPVTSLPHPFEPRPADPRERFGGSFRGPVTAGLASRIGFAWSRWMPRGKWHALQPEPGRFDWPDEEIALLERLGVSAHLVLYGWPEWAMEKDHPLPRDMRWPADDPRWADLSEENRTAWDRFVVAAVERYRGRPVIFELENEPELDRWKDGFQAEYAKFTARTARLIKMTDPEARVMVNNLYGIPSGLNRRWLEETGGEHVDVVSWHDYRAGALTTGPAIARMRGELDKLGADHVEIWFNEGWSFTNPATDEPPAATGLTSAESTAAQLASVAEVTAAGQAKTVLFHTGYETHGMSFWDYSGPGTQLWDWDGNPLPLVAGWNVLCHHVGLSEAVGIVRPPGLVCCVFEDLRNGRGVVVAFADGTADGGTAEGAATLPLPAAAGAVSREGTTGGVAPAGSAVALPALGNPIYLFTDRADPLSGADWLALLEPLDRRNTAFVTGGGTYELPATWDGEVGNPATAEGTPVWRLDQIWPPDPTRGEHYRPLVWQDGWWRAPADAFAGQPKAERRPEGLRLEVRAKHGSPERERLAALAFVAPEAGTYAVRGKARGRIWEGAAPFRLDVLKKTAAGAAIVGTVELVPGEAVALPAVAVDLAAGGELVFSPRIDGHYKGGEVTLTDLTVERR